MMRMSKPAFLLRAAAVLAAALLLSACARVREPEAPVGPSFRIATYNVNWSGYRADLTAKAIRECRADVVCLQETTPDWEPFLRAELSGDYPHCLFRHGRGAGGMAVFSKWEIHENAWAKPPAGWFNGWVLNVATPAGAVQVLAVHLRPPLSDAGGVSVGAYFSSKKARQTDVSQFLGLLQRGSATIVLGDFNEDDDGKAVEWLESQGLTDALREFDRKSITWRWPTRLWTLTGRFDHLLYSPELYCCRAEVAEGAGASDHFPVTAVFESARGRQKPAPAAKP
jgi:endonuclease/exonuclease/phosphatase family metal-dependent hydrolase